MDLGCGDGILTEELLRANNAISSTLIDGNEGMLSKAKERLKTFKSVHFIKATFQDIFNGVVELVNYDFCVSSMAIHHLEMAEKSALFRIYSIPLKLRRPFCKYGCCTPSVRRT